MDTPIPVSQNWLAWVYVPGYVLTKNEQSAIFTTWPLQNSQ